jgi:hypothetical protein
MASTQSKLHTSLSDTDPFDSLLTLEDTLYTTAYTSGSLAGARAGRIEGRIFGLEQGFEKFAKLGELHGRSVVWGARTLTPKRTGPSDSSRDVEVAKEDELETEKEEGNTSLPDLPTNPRLVNNITLLHSLTDPQTFSTENTEDAVADFDDRFKRAGAKAKVIERITGESESSNSKSPDGSPALNEGGKKKGDDSIEDFAGSRLVR